MQRATLLDVVVLVVIVKIIILASIKLLVGIERIRSIKILPQFEIYHIQPQVKMLNKIKTMLLILITLFISHGTVHTDHFRS